MGTRPPSGVKLSCIALTEPFEAAVVATAQSALFVMPKRVSLPSMLPPAWSALETRSAPAPESAGLPACSAATVAKSSGTKITSIAASTAQPWRRSPTSRPKVKQSAAGMSRIASTSRKFDSGVGFSNGCAELTLKKPPPLVPSCLMATCEAAGPTASVCEPAVTAASKGLHHALRHERERQHERQRQQHVERAPREVDPEAADALRRPPREPAEQRDEHRHARRRRDEVLHRQAQHLGEVAHRRLAAVALPVGVGGEAHRRVERHLGRDRAEPAGLSGSAPARAAARTRPGRPRG